MVEKFVDALVWAFWPVYLHQRGVDLPGIGWIVGVYGFTWGAVQFFTGRLSDRPGRHLLNSWGMWICGAGVALMPMGSGSVWWSMSAAIAGFGMAMLYPNLSAAVADIAHRAGAPRPSASTAFGATWAMASGRSAWALQQRSAAASSAFWFVAVAMLASGAVLYRWGEETHPRLNPAL